MQVIWEHDVPFTILGGGSNMLVSDAGVRGVVVLNRARRVRFELKQPPWPSGANRAPTLALLPGRLPPGGWQAWSGRPEYPARSVGRWLEMPAPMVATWLAIYCWQKSCTVMKARKPDCPFEKFGRWSGWSSRTGAAF